MQATKVQKNVEPITISECPNNFWSSQLTFCKKTCGDSNQSENLHCGVTKVSITYNMVHHEGVPVSSYYVIAEFASVRIIFGATVTYMHCVIGSSVPLGILVEGNSVKRVTLC